MNYPKQVNEIAYLASLLGNEENTGINEKNKIVTVTFNSLINEVYQALNQVHSIHNETIAYFCKSFLTLTNKDLLTTFLKIDKKENNLVDIKDWLNITIKNIYKLSKLHSKGLLTYYKNNNTIFAATKKINDQLDTNTHIHLEDYQKPYHSLFPERKGNTVISLYSNAYDTEDHHSGLFVDICHDIDHAKSNITLTAWLISIDFDLGMRDKMKLSERLIRAASRGVKITLLLWDSITPQGLIEMRKVKKMLHSISDPEIQNNIAIKTTHRAIGYSDHQKLLIIDSQKLYMGGFDLTHKRENPQRWHDLHLAIKGPCVTDALKMVKAHWQAIDKNRCLSTDSLTKKQIDYNGISNLQQAIDLSESIQNTNELPTDDDTTMQLLVGMKHKYFDNLMLWNKAYGNTTHTSEIQSAYLQVVANAKHFLYMENQNFTGQYSNTKSCNIVLNAIIEKIKEKYQQGLPFHFYCLIPIFPGPNINQLPTQLLTLRQWRTIKWFIEMVNHITNGQAANYITFFSTGMQTCTKTEVSFIQKYTHGKLLIADDQELILGSANMTERSLAGNRDSEVILRLKGQAEIHDYRIKLMKEHLGVTNLTSELQYHPENVQSVAEFVRILEDNLKRLQSLENNRIVYGTPWGNIPKAHLMEGVKPPLVPSNGPIPESLIKQIPYTRKLLA